MQHFSENTQFLGFLFLPGSAEALVRWGGKIKYILIAYFLGNVCAKNSRNRTVYVKIIQVKGGTFLRHSVLISENEFNDDIVGHLSNKDLILRFYSKNLPPTDCLNYKSDDENVLAKFTSHFKEVNKPNTAEADEAYKAKITVYVSSHGDTADKIPLIDVVYAKAA